MDSINVRCPINNLSFGNVSYNILRELYKSKTKVNLFPVGQKVDFSAFDKSPASFSEFIKESVENRNLKVKRNYPFLNIWHINQSENKISDYNILYTFHETGEVTEAEKSLCSLYDNVVFGSTYARDAFKKAGLTNASFAPLGLDEDIVQVDREYLSGKIHFGLMGKWEQRKNTAKIIKLWAERFGGDSKYQLTCCVNNAFMKEEDLKGQIFRATDSKKHNNINFLKFLPKNSQVNDYLNSIDIDLGGLSGAEGWNLPCFNSTALGAWPIVLNATSHKDWANKENSILIEPSSESSIVDNKFFFDHSEFNQGHMYNFSAEDFNKAIDLAIEKVAKGQTNIKGKEIRKNFTYKNTLENILQSII